MGYIKKVVVWVIAALFALIVALFSLANRTPVELDLWPLAFKQDIPVFALMLACVAFGIFWGGFAAWMSAGTARKRAREATRRGDVLESDLRHAEERNARLEEELKSLRAEHRVGKAPLGGPDGSKTLSLPSKTSDAA